MATNLGGFSADKFACWVLAGNPPNNDAPERTQLTYDRDTVLVCGVAYLNDLAQRAREQPAALAKDFGERLAPKPGPSAKEMSAVADLAERTSLYAQTHLPGQPVSDWNQSRKKTFAEGRIQVDVFQGGEPGLESHYVVASVSIDGRVVDIGKEEKLDAIADRAARAAVDGRSGLAPGPCFGGEPLSAKDARDLAAATHEAADLMKALRQGQTVEQWELRRESLDPTQKR